MNRMLKEDSKSRLVKLLTDTFRFEDQDLDFGIYRIMNQKRDQIREFIEEGLIEKINEQLELIGEEQKREIREKLKELKGKIKEAYGEHAFKDKELKEEFREYPLGEKYSNKLSLLEKVKLSEDVERQIYNHIYSFFSRYYDRGDFVSKRRFGRTNRYVVPYSGEETLFHWTNKNQYYIKTASQFKRYTFKTDGLTVNFGILEAEEEKTNAKEDKSRYFVVSERKPFEFNDNVLNIYFEYRSLEDQEIEERLL